EVDVADILAAYPGLVGDRADQVGRPYSMALTHPEEEPRRRLAPTRRTSRGSTRHRPQGLSRKLRRCRRTAAAVDSPLVAHRCPFRGHLEGGRSELIYVARGGKILDNRQEGVELPAVEDLEQLVSEVLTPPHRQVGGRRQAKRD